MRQLPDVIALNEKFGGRDDFAIVTVSLDRTNTIDRMHEVIEEYGITYPVLHQFVDGNPWTVGYTVRYIPKSVLIDPMGNIWGDFHFNENSAEILDFLLAQDEGYLPVIFESTVGPWEGNNTPSESDESIHSGAGDFIHAEIYSPTHLDAETTLTVSYFGGDGQNTSFVIDFPDYDGFGYAQQTWPIDGLAGAKSVKYVLELVMPGSEHLNGGKGLVISKSGTFRFEEEE